MPKRGQYKWRKRPKVLLRIFVCRPKRLSCCFLRLTKPVGRRIITRDATSEKLHEIMCENPSGVLLIRDEVPGWLGTLDKPGREGERGFFLSAWNGDTGYTIDRIGRGSVHVDACCLSMLGGIQPARLRSYLADALHDGPLNDGLLQRFQVLVYPDIPKDWHYVDRPPTRKQSRTRCAGITDWLTWTRHNRSGSALTATRKNYSLPGWPVLEPTRTTDRWLREIACL